MTFDSARSKLRAVDDIFHEKITYEMAKAKTKVAGRETTDQKERLFEEYFVCTREAMHSLERMFEVSGVVEQVLGSGEQDEQKAKLRASSAWATAMRLYDYAVDGIQEHGLGGDEIVIDGSEVLMLVTTENHKPSSDWDDIVWMGDGRFSLDDGRSLHVKKLALLANVDVRTVRNAISAGILKADSSSDSVYIENESARRWLLGRRGFKPTVSTAGDSQLGLHQVRTPGEFATFLAAQRAEIGLDGEVENPGQIHPSVTAESLKELEAGLFPLPLDAVFPLAAYYRVDRKEFLDCVMRVFFIDELRALTTERKGGK